MKHSIKMALMALTLVTPNVFAAAGDVKVSALTLDQQDCVSELLKRDYGISRDTTALSDKFSDTDLQEARAAQPVFDNLIDKLQAQIGNMAPTKTVDQMYTALEPDFMTSTGIKKNTESGHHENPVFSACFYCALTEWIRDGGLVG